jgi:hypothetical protein
MEMNCKLQALAGLIPREEPPVPFGEELHRSFAELCRILVLIIENKTTN